MRPTNRDLKYQCPKCAREMQLTLNEYSKSIFSCPYCGAKGSTVAMQHHQLPVSVSRTPMRTLEEILKAHGLEELKATFESQGIEDSMLVDLTDQELLNIGVTKLGDRKKLLKEFSCFGGREHQEDASTHMADGEHSIAALNISGNIRARPGVITTVADDIYPPSNPTSSFISAPLKYIQPYLLFILGAIGALILYGTIRNNTLIFRWIRFGIALLGLGLTSHAAHLLRARHKKDSPLSAVFGFGVFASIVLAIHGCSEIKSGKGAPKSEAADKKTSNAETYGFVEAPKVDGNSLTAIAEVSGGYMSSEEIMLFNISGRLYEPVLIPLVKVARSKPDVTLISISVIMKAETLVNRYGDRFPKKPYYLGTITVNSEKLQELRKFKSWLLIDSRTEAELYQDFASGMAAKVMKEGYKQ